MAGYAQADEDRQAEAGPCPADLGVVSGDDPAGLQRLDPAQARGRRQADRIGQVDVGDPAVALQRRDDGTIHPVWRMLRHEIKRTVSIGAISWRHSARSGAIFAIACEPFSARLGP